MKIPNSFEEIRRREPRFTWHAYLTGGRLLWLPECYICRQPITVPADANLVLHGADEFQKTVAVKVDGVELEPLIGTALAVHKYCDHERLKPWVPLAGVLKRTDHF